MGEVEGGSGVAGEFGGEREGVFGEVRTVQRHEDRTDHGSPLRGEVSDLLVSFANHVPLPKPAATPD